MKFNFTKEDWQLYCSEEGCDKVAEILNETLSIALDNYWDRRKSGTLHKKSI